MANILELRCVICNRGYQPEAVTYTCPDCGEVGTLDILYDYASLKTSIDRDALSHSQESSVWRYKSLLPIGAEAEVPPLSVGWTPLYDTPRIAHTLGLKQAWVKDDGQNPTASLKDRASSMVVARAMEQGIPIVSTASTGNAAAALAGVCASVENVGSVIFVPASAPEAKIAQLLVYGATVLLIEGSYDDAFDLCMQTCEERSWYSRNTGVNPFTTEGKKTVSLEIAEQLNWEVPDVVVVSVGDGSIISGMHKGFVDLHRLGWIQSIPRLIGVQASGSSALVHAWANGLDAVAMKPMPAETIADSISAGLPRDRAKALRAVRETDGAFIAVEDEDIVSAIPELAQLSGVFAEPAAAASFAGAKRAVQSGIIQPDDRCLLLVTGNGLKDIATARQSVATAVRVKPEMTAVREALSKIREGYD